MVPERVVSLITAFDPPYLLLTPIFTNNPSENSSSQLSGIIWKMA